MSFEDPRRVLARHGLRPKRGFSQNFLCSPHAIERIAAAALEHEQFATVLELGPGCGTLTAALLSRGANVLAIERDPDMQQVLAQEFADRPLQVRAGDAAEVDYAALAQELGGPVAVVGNLPYAITGAILRRFVDDYQHVARAVVMVQREVAERLIAPPGTSGYGALTVFCGNVYECQRVVHVPRTAFHPPPQVDSTVVALTPRPTPLTPPNRFFQRVVQCAFQARRKTLRNALRNSTGGDSALVEQVLLRAGITPGLRGEVLSIADFGKLAHALSEVQSQEPAP